MILISACLAGINCKYNGGNNFNEKAFELVKSGKAIPVCPEQLGGLTTPRTPAETKMINNEIHVITKDGVDETERFKKGAMEVLRIAKELEVEKVVLQSRSPSCGVGKVYSGNFDGQLVDGNGILAQLLIDNGIKVIDITEM